MGIKKNQFVHKALFAFTEVVPSPPPPPTYSTEFRLQLTYCGTRYTEGKKERYRICGTLGACLTRHSLNQPSSPVVLEFELKFGRDLGEYGNTWKPDGGIKRFVFNRTSGDAPPLDPIKAANLANRVSKVTINDVVMWRKGVDTIVGGEFVFADVYPFDYRSSEILKLKIYIDGE